MERFRERSSIPPVAVPPIRKLADGDGAVQEGKLLVKAAAHLAEGLGKVKEVIGDEVMVGPMPALGEGDGALEHGHRLGRAARPKQGLA